MEDLNFYESVYALARHIPEGRVTSYGAIARALGREGAARIVGYAMGNAGKAEPPVPAHRVLNSKGELSAKAAFGHPNLMQQLLENEGVQIKNDRVINFKSVFWDPLVEDII
ncbi:MGMT family protein [Olivibacter sp. SDN3]|uniref:MGMT family protein n=1 Tax=Olivibacter sp. SDN3 TaxID=2764720 RepID=UPI00165131F2|nr:MGMT family protein [Olivibacter sp. SDN3]QNL51293.1 MGMT family protein [Olivibacter sp. SDN3]